MSKLSVPSPDDFEDKILQEVGLYEHLGEESVEVWDADFELAGTLEDWLRDLPQDGPLPARLEDVTRFVVKGSEEPPPSRWRLVGDYVERWVVVEEKIRATSDEAHFVACLQNRRILGWNVTRYLRRAGKPKRFTVVDGKVVFYDALGNEVEPSPSTLQGEALRDHVLSLQIAPEDDALYNGYYPTIPGNDVAHLDENADKMQRHQRGEPIKLKNPEILPNGKVEDPYLRGGTEIRGGRAEHRRKTKNMVYVDAGYNRDMSRLREETKAKQKAQSLRKVERVVSVMPRKAWDL